MAARLLFVGHLLDDLRSLVAVAAQVKSQGRFEPLFLVTGPGEARAQGEAYIRAEGYPVLDGPFETNDGADSQYLLIKQWRLWRNNRRLIKELLAKVKPALILSSVNVTRNLFLDEATRLGYPTILLQVALWASREFYEALHAEDLHWAEYHFTPEQRRAKQRERQIQGWFKMGARPGWQVHTTAIAVQGPYWQNLLHQDGIPSEQLVVTGNPSCDWAYEARQRPSVERAYVYERLGLATGTPYFLYCRENYNRLFGPPTAQSRETPIRIVRTLRAADPNIPIVVKLHPREGEDEIQLLRDAVPDLIVIHDFPLMDLLAESYICVSTISTTLLWSAALDKPTVSAFFWKTRSYYLKEMDWSGVERVLTEEELIEAIQRYRNDAASTEAWRQKRAAFVAQQMPQDGQSVERIVTLINKLALN